RRRPERGGGDTGRLILEIDAHARKPVQIAAVQAPDETSSSSIVVFDEQQAGELDARDLLCLFEQLFRNRLGVVAAACAVGHAGSRLGLPLAGKIGTRWSARSHESENRGQAEDGGEREREPGAP